MARLVPIDGDPFAAPRLTPVDFNPFDVAEIARRQNAAGTAPPPDPRDVAAEQRRQDRNRGIEPAPQRTPQDAQRLNRIGAGREQVGDREALAIEQQAPSRQRELADNTDAANPDVRNTMAYIGTRLHQLNPQQYPWLFRNGAPLAAPEIADLISRSSDEIEGMSPQDATNYLFGRREMRPANAAASLGQRSAPPRIQDPLLRNQTPGPDGSYQERTGWDLANSDLAQPAEPQPDTWGERVHKFLRRTGDLFSESFNGLLMREAEYHTGPASYSAAGDQAFDSSGNQLYHTVQSEGQRLVVESRELQDTPGRRAFLAAQSDLQRNGYNFGGATDSYLTQTAESLVQMLPVVAAGIVTRGRSLEGEVEAAPGTLLGRMAQGFGNEVAENRGSLGVLYQQQAGQQYGQSRTQQGRDPTAAMIDSNVFGLAEAIPEALPMGSLMRPGGRFLPRLLRTAGFEGASEMMTQAVEDAYSAGVIGQDMTWGQAWANMRDAGIIGGLMGGGMTTVEAPFHRPGTHGAAPGEIPTPTSAPGVDPGIREAAAAAPPNITPEDQASPLPTDLIAQGKKAAADALATTQADQIVGDNIGHQIGDHVAVTIGGQTRTGQIHDAFTEEDPETGTHHGAVIGWEDGSTTRERFSDLHDAGARIERPGARLEGAPAREIVRRHIAQAESGGNVNAANPNSTASGLFQILDSTFRHYYEQVYGRDPGEHPDRAVKDDPAVQNRLMDRMLDDYEHALRAHGHEVTAGNLYLNHFLGTGGANTILSNPNAPIESLVDSRVIRANPFLRGMTGADVAAWAARRMGGHLSPEQLASGATAPTDEGPQPDFSWIDRPVDQAGTPATAPEVAPTVATAAEGDRGPAIGRGDETASPEFRSWFGDSRVLDSEGAPLTVYHATRKSFEQFSLGRSEGGFFFAPSPDEAYPHNRGALPIGRKRTISAYVSLQNPLDIGRDDIDFRKVTMGATRAYREGLQARGYDGVILRNDDGSIREVVAFDPSQIRRVTDVLQTGDGTRAAPITATTAEHVDLAAQNAAQPTEAQAEAGNYQKSHVRVQGLDISIENAKGSERSGVDPNGQPWTVQMPATYGYIKRTNGQDGEQVDVYVGDHPTEPRVYVIDQVHADTGAPDEHKALIGFPSEEAALATYHQAFSDGKGPDRVGAVTPMDMSQFKDWLKNGDTQAPATTAQLSDITGQLESAPETGGNASEGQLQSDNVASFNAENHVAAMRAYVANSTGSLNDTEKMGKALGLTSEQTHRVMGALAAQPDSGIRMTKGRPAGVRRQLLAVAQIVNGKQRAARYRTITYRPAVPARFQRVPVRTAPLHFMEWVRAQGGVKTDRHDLRNVGGLANHPGVINNRSGLSLDQLGERMAESGWATERPTEAHVLDMLQLGSTAKVYRPEDGHALTEAQNGNAEAAKTSADEETLRTLRDDFGLTLDDDGISRAVEYMSQGKAPIQALTEAANDAAVDTLETGASETGNDALLDVPESAHGGVHDEAAGTGDHGPAEAVARPEGQPQDAKERADANAESDQNRQAAGEGVATDLLGKPAEQPAPKAEAPAESQPDMLGTQPGDERRALERKGEGRIQSSATQKAPGSEGGLFDQRDTTGDLTQPESNPDPVEKAKAALQSALDVLNGKTPEAPVAEAAPAETSPEPTPTVEAEPPPEPSGVAEPTAQFDIWNYVNAPESDVRRDTEAVPPRRGGAIRALGIADDLRRERSAALVGRTVGSAQELAHVAQVYRDPRFETLRVFFMKGNEIVHATGVSSRLPGSAPLLPNNLSLPNFNVWLEQTMGQTEADGFYMLHNHPSGDPNPSRDDITITRTVAENVEGFRGHVVINSNKFAVIPATGQPTVHEKNFGVDRLFKASKPHPSLGQYIDNASDLAAVGKMVQTPGHVTVIGRDAGAKVRVVADYPESDLQRPPLILAAALRRLMRQSGASMMFVVGSREAIDSAAVIRAQRNGLITEAVDLNGELSGRMPNSAMPFGETKGQFVAEDRVGFDQRSPASIWNDQLNYARDLTGAAKTIGKKDKIAAAFDRFRINFQDRVLPLLRTQTAIERVIGRPLTEEEQPYRQEALYTGRVGDQFEKLADNIVEPLFEAMKENGITSDELESYLYARHAPERNAKLEKEGVQDGSGMSDVEAAAILSRIEKAGKTEALKNVATWFDKLNAFAMETRVAGGLMNQEQADEWKSVYPNYAPLRGQRELPEEERPNMGQSGFSVKGPESRRAFGRKSLADDILAHAIVQAQEAVVRAEKNRVATELYNLAKANPDPNFWEIQKVTMKKRINKDTGMIESYAVTQATADDMKYTVNLKVNGKAQRVTFNRHNPAAVKAAEAMRRFNEPELNVQVLQHVNQWLSRVNTMLSPDFIWRNALRDMETAIANLSENDMKGLRRDVIASYPKALAAAERGAFKRPGDSEWDQAWKDYSAEGGRISFNQIESVDDLRKQIEQRFARIQASKLSPKEAGLRMWDGLKWTFNKIEQVNQGVENATRLSVYKNLVDRGVSKKQAAFAAKEVTVNFNRRGVYGALVNSLYLFANASTQGSARMILALRHRRVQKIAGSMIVAGAVVAMMNAAMGGNDDDGVPYYDKIAEWEKANNLIFMIPGSGGRYIKIPMAYGYNIFPDLGRQLVDVFRGHTHAMDAVGNWLGNAANSFNPISGQESLANFIAPTVVDPLVDLYVDNRDFADRPIMPDQPAFGPPVPDSQRFWPNVPPYFRALTDFLNRSTGGDQVQPGWIDVSPETLNYLTQQATGSAGATITRLGSIVGKMVDGDPTTNVEMNDIPVLRTMIGAKPSWYDRSAFYARLQSVQNTVEQDREYHRLGDQQGQRNFVAAHRDVLELHAAANQAQHEMQLIRRAKTQAEIAYDAGRITRARYDQIRTAAAAREERLFSRWNAIYLRTVHDPVQPQR